MKEIKKTLVQKALQRHKKIKLLPGKKDHSFTFDENFAILWYNTHDGSTHIVTHNIIQGGKSDR
jgi:hypothetical protein